MKKLIISISLIFAVFGCKNSNDFKIFQKIITTDLIKKSLGKDNAKGIQIESSKSKDEAIYTIRVPNKIFNKEVLKNLFEIKIKIGGTILTAERLEKHNKEVQKQKQEATKAYKIYLEKVSPEKRLKFISKKSIDLLISDLNPKIGQKAIKTSLPPGNKIIIFTTSDGKYDIQTSSIQKIKKGAHFEDMICNIHLKNFAELISEKYNKEILEQEKF